MAGVYAEQTSDSVNWGSYVAAVKNGRSFVTNAPALLLNLNGESKPGDIVASGDQLFSLTVSSAVAVDNIEILVNGKIIWTGGGLNAGDTKTFKGNVSLPEGGWIAARAHGGTTSWPLMDSYPFGHTSPIWINQIGSTDPSAKAVAEDELRSALLTLELQARERYGDEDISLLISRIHRAKATLSR